MKYASFLLLLGFVTGWAQNPIESEIINLGDFTMSNDASAAFLLLEETPTDIYTADNLKALSLHVLDNLGQSLSIELAPYFFISKNNPNRTYFTYMGIDNSDVDHPKQNVFSGFNQTNISLGYVDKEFANIGEPKKTYAIGGNTTLLRWYSKTDLKRVLENTNNIQKGLLLLTIPPEVAGDPEALKKYCQSNAFKDEYQKLIAPYQKSYKPTLRLDGGLGYSFLFKENNTNSDTATRFGAWATGELSILLNYGAKAKTNNYFNALFSGRYIEDGFNLLEDGSYQTLYYRDIGGKVEFEFGALAFSYEFLKRNGVVDSERSVGTIKYTFSSSVSINGGFGKDFPSDDNLVTVFGIHWGFNMGDQRIALKNLGN